MLQIGIVFGVCLVGETVAHYLPFPIPSSVISMILLFVLLLTGWLRVEHIREKTDFLLKNMAFFFIPAGVGIMGQFDLLRDNLLPFGVICVATTFLTFGVTVLAVRGTIRLQNKIAGRSRNRADGKKGGEE